MFHVRERKQVSFTRDKENTKSSFACVYKIHLTTTIIFFFSPLSSLLFSSKFWILQNQSLSLPFFVNQEKEGEWVQVLFFSSFSILMVWSVGGFSFSVLSLFTLQGILLEKAFLLCSLCIAFIYYKVFFLCLQIF